jgi:hypothetical protein
MRDAVTERDLPWRSRKSRARWCGGHVGREHVWVRGIPRNQPGWRPPCGFREWRGRIGTNGSYWLCVEAEYCDRCGRVNKRGLERDCATIPDGAPLWRDWLRRVP